MPHKLTTTTDTETFKDATLNMFIIYIKIRPNILVNTKIYGYFLFTHSYYLYGEGSDQQICISMS